MALWYVMALWDPCDALWYVMAYDPYKPSMALTFRASSCSAVLSSDAVEAWERTRCKWCPYVIFGTQPH